MDESQATSSRIPYPVASTMAIEAANTSGCVDPILIRELLNARGPEAVIEQHEHLGMQLRFLNLNGCWGLSPYRLHEILQNCPEIERIDLCNCRDDEDLPYKFYRCGECIPLIALLPQDNKITCIDTDDFHVQSTLEPIRCSIWYRVVKELDDSSSWSMLELAPRRPGQRPVISPVHYSSTHIFEQIIKTPSFHHLRILSLSNLSSTHLAALTQTPLLRLEELSLGNCRRINEYGVITLIGWRTLDQLHSLTLRQFPSLKLAHWRALVTFRDLSHLRILRLIDCEFLPVTATIAPLSRSTLLEELDMSRNSERLRPRTSWAGYTCPTFPHLKQLILQNQPRIPISEEKFPALEMFRYTTDG